LIDLRLIKSEKIKGKNENNLWIEEKRINEITNLIKIFKDKI
jgi:hypothetical protein